MIHINQSQSQLFCKYCRSPTYNESDFHPACQQIIDDYPRELHVKNCKDNFWIYLCHDLKLQILLFSKDLCKIKGDGFTITFNELIEVSHHNYIYSNCWNFFTLSLLIKDPKSDNEFWIPFKSGASHDFASDWILLKIRVEKTDHKNWKAHFST